MIRQNGPSFNFKGWNLTQLKSITPMASSILLALPVSRILVVRVTDWKNRRSDVLGRGNSKTCDERGQGVWAGRQGKELSGQGGGGILDLHKPWRQGSNGAIPEWRKDLFQELS